MTVLLCSCRKGFVGSLLLLTILSAGRLQAAAPEVLDPRLELTLIATHPQIVTPTGLTFDARGRLLVIECHTHFRPEGYEGPAKDRILILEDADGDGQAETPRTFFEGTEATMGLAAGPEGWIYVATRAQIFRLRDRDGDGQAEEREDVARLETTGNYPHNGLSGMAFDGLGRLYFGLGENIGEPYELVGQDGGRLRGGGEGGNIFRCTADGRELMRLATGFWNPFGICFDPAGRMFTVDNDPDESPPCRLLHVVPGGDYGYQFRFGRSGRHPLQAWNGELPGTLPMLAGTGEAPCDVVAVGDSLWVTSWGENRIECYELEPQGASFRARRTIVVQGDQHFRPVDFAVGPDNALYFTDWVDRSYPVHRAGRVWKLAWRAGGPQGQLPPLSVAERRADKLRNSPEVAALDDADPFIRQATVWGLARQKDLANKAWQDLPTGPQRLGVLEALRWQARDSKPLDDLALHRLLHRALADRDPAVRVFALRWVADDRREPLRGDIEQLLRRADLDEQELLASLAALDWLETKPENTPVSQERRLLAMLENTELAPGLRALALRLISLDSERLNVERLRQHASSGLAPLDREAARTLALSALPSAKQATAELIVSDKLPAELRADLVLGLVGQPEQRALLERLAADPARGVQQAAQQALAEHPAAPASGANRPPADDVGAWLALVGTGGDPSAGWRVFFGAHAAKCGACHAFQGRGGSAAGGFRIGPDLTLVGQQLTRRRLLESILQPSREMAPQYVPWLLETADGKALTGLSLARIDDERKERFIGTDGQPFELESAAIAHRRAADASIMPAGLETQLSVEELRDLLALLTQTSYAAAK